jgi:hypothetical protein
MVKNIGGDMVFGLEIKKSFFDSLTEEEKAVALFSKDFLNE